MVDKQIGSKIRVLRCIRHMTQKELAGKMSISFQQLQKNEKGDSKITCSRLVRLAGILEVDINYFFEDLAELQTSPATALAQKTKNVGHVLSREEIKVLSEYTRIKDRNVTRSIRYILTQLAKGQVVSGNGKKNRS